MNAAVGATVQWWDRGTNWTVHVMSKDLQMQLELKQTPAKQHLRKGQILPPHHPQFLLGPPGGEENLGRHGSNEKVDEIGKTKERMGEEMKPWQRKDRGVC